MKVKIADYLIKRMLPSLNKYLINTSQQILSLQRVWFRYRYHSAKDDVGFLKRIPARTSFKNESEVIILIPHLGIDSRFYAGLRMIVALAVEILRSGKSVNLINTEVDGDQQTTTRVLKHIKQYFPDSDLTNLSISFRNQICNVSPKDIAITTSWRTWYGTEDITSNVGKIYYFIQDFEPAFYPWSTEYALALDTYQRDFVPIFSSHYLKEYFTQSGYKFAKDALQYDLYIDKKIFYPANIQKLSLPSRTRKLILYGRQSTARNLFGLGVQVIASVSHESPHLLTDWEIISVGEKHPEISLPNNMKIRSIGKLSLGEYGDLLRESDVGLSLMLSPHPSYPPLEMLSCGLIVVTNNYANKNLSNDYLNMYSSPPAVHPLKETLMLALKNSDFFAERIANTQKNNICDSRESSFSSSVGDIVKSLSSMERANP